MARATIAMAVTRSVRTSSMRACAQARASLARLRGAWLPCVAALWLLAHAASARADRENCLAAHEEGQELRLRGSLSAAHERFAMCADPSCPKVISRDCASLLQELDKTLPTVVFEVRVHDGTKLEDARVFANGALLQRRLEGRPVALDPGPYRIRIEADGYAPDEREITVYAGERERRVRFTLSSQASVAQASAARASARDAPSARAYRAPLATYVLGGSALATLGAGIGMGAAGKHEYDRLKARCAAPEGCDESDTKKGKRLYIAADVAFGVAGGLAVAATWLYVARLLDERRAANAFRSNISASVGPAGGSLVYQRAF